MKYLCRIEFEFPRDMGGEEIAAYRARETVYVHDLQRSGAMESLFRVVGENANYSILDVESNDRLHEILTGLPMYPFMTISTTALATHPNSLR